MLQVNFAEINEYSKKIDIAANEYNQKMNEFYSIIEELNQKLKNQENTNFINKANSYKKDIMILGNTLTNYAAFLKNALSTIEDAQSENTSSANNL